MPRKRYFIRRSRISYCVSNISLRSVSGATASGGQRTIGPLHSPLAAAGDSARTNIERIPVRLQSMAGRDVLHAGDVNPVTAQRIPDI